MTDNDLLRDMKVAWEYTYLHDDWVAPLEEELAGLTAQDAAWKPAPSARSIWEIVLHMAVWNENIIARMEAGEKVRPAEGAWPAMPEEVTGAAWELAKDRLRRSIVAIGDLFDAPNLDYIHRGPFGLSDLLVRYIHMGYHIGQITKLREERMRRS